jgi:hypothetical protein
MPYPVQHLIEDRGFPVSVKGDDSIAHALDLMIKYEFSQLPVIDEESKPIGLITNDSILKAIKMFGVTIEKLIVTDAIVKVSNYYRPEDDLFGLLDGLKTTNAALIIDGEGKIIGIVTSYDTTEYIRRRAEDIMLVEDIESMIKDIILSAFSDENGEVNQDKLTEAIREITSSKKELKAKFGKALSAYLENDYGEKKNVDQKLLNESIIYLQEKEDKRNFNDLTMNEYIQLLLRKECWSHIHSYYKTKLEGGDILKLLENVRDTRNVLTHFRGEISDSQRDSLRFTTTWLNQLQKPICIDRQTQQADAPMIEQVEPQDSRYTPLTDYLHNQKGDVNRLSLTFDEIEDIIGAKLPDSARHHRVWWANDTSSLRHSSSWLDADWKTTNINMNEGTIVFARIRARDKSYIKFFSRVLSELRDRDDIAIRNISPDGASWMILKGIPDPGPQYGYFGYSFSRNRRFRVELYIDAYDQKKTKEIFDRLYADRDLLESQIDPITWERINEKRASRIAIYHEGAITDQPKDLTELKNWAVNTMVEFQKIFTNPTSNVIKDVMDLSNSP